MICEHCDVTVDDLQGVEGSTTCSDSPACNNCVEVAQLENIIARLKTKQCELKRNINRVHSPFIRIIPPEIIARISGFAITDFTIIGSLPDAILLSSVCSDWRRAVVGTPKLWSSIRIDLPSILVSQTSDIASGTLPRLATFIDEWLSRSGQLPLNISLCYGHNDDATLPYGDDDEDPSDLLTPSLEAYRPIFRILDQYSSRWRSLNICIPPALLQFFREPDSLPLLEQLQIATPSMTDSCYIINFPRAPRLKTVEIKQFMNHKSRISDYIGIHWDTVTHLSVTSISRNNLFAILLMNPQLVHCTFRKVFSDNTTNPFLNYQIVSSMTYLSLHHNASQILNSIILPCLETLVLGNATTNSDPVIAFLERSACPLHSLSLLNWHDCKTDRYIPLLEFLSPSLKRLVISRGPSTINATEDYLSLLTRIYASQFKEVGSDFLPHLEVFEYREEESSTLETSMLNLPSRNYPKLLIPLCSVHINIDASIIDKYLSPGISDILHHLEKDGILTYN